MAVGLAVSQRCSRWSRGGWTSTASVVRTTVEVMVLAPSARDLTDDERELVELARSTIDATTDAGPDQDGVHTMGAAVRAADGRTFPGVNLYHPGVRVLPTDEGIESVSILDLMPLASRWTVEGGTEAYDPDLFAAP